MSKKNESDIFDWITIVEEEINVNSDRSLIITIAAILDTQLENLLRRFMISDNKVDEKLFNNNSPLSTFSSKISLCYYLGLISKYDYETIDTIRKVRNVFAHEIKIKRIEDSEKVKSLCNILTIPEDIYIPDTFFDSNNDYKVNSLETLPLKEKIIRVFKNLTVYLEYRNVDLFDDKRKKYNNISFVEVLQNCLEKVRKNSQKLYVLNKKYKELLIDKLNTSDIDDMNKKDILEKIQDIDNLLEAYDNGNIFYGLDIDDTEKVKKSLQSIDLQIKKMKDS